MKALIPAAGLGTRWYPWSKVISKELLPLGRYLVIHYVLEEAVAAGIREIGIIISEAKQLIRTYVEKVSQTQHPETRIVWFYQNSARGVADALLCAKEWVGDRPTAVICPDEIHPSQKGDSSSYAGHMKILRVAGLVLQLINRNVDRPSYKLKKSVRIYFTLMDSVRINLHSRLDTARVVIFPIQV